MCRFATRALDGRTTNASSRNGSGFGGRSGSARAVSVTTRTGTLTTSRGSCVATRWCWPSRRILRTRTTPLDGQLTAARGCIGRTETGPLRVVKLPFPRPVVMNGERLPASYANFYIANGVVLVPTFNDPNDRVALNTLAELMPSHKVVGIHAVDLAWGLGTIHCLTQQEPHDNAIDGLTVRDCVRVVRRCEGVRRGRAYGPPVGRDAKGPLLTSPLNPGLRTNRD